MYVCVIFVYPFVVDFANPFRFRDTCWYKRIGLISLDICLSSSRVEPFGTYKKNSLEIYARIFQSNILNF